GGVVPVAVARRRRATPGVGAATRATPATAAPTSLTATLRASIPGGAPPGALAAVAGLLLAAHFAAWICSRWWRPVAGAVALVATQPVWAALIGRLTGERLAAGGWLGIVVALAGV